MSATSTKRTATLLWSAKRPNAVGATWKVYRLNPPIPTKIGPSEHVIVSATTAPRSGPETYIFPAKRDGNSWDRASSIELDGSYRGSADHEEALRRAGYTVHQS